MSGVAFNACNDVMKWFAPNKQIEAVLMWMSLMINSWAQTAKHNATAFNTGCVA